MFCLYVCETHITNKQIAQGCRQLWYQHVNNRWSIYWGEHFWPNFHFTQCAPASLRVHLLETEVISSRLNNRALTYLLLSDKMNPSDVWLAEKYRLSFVCAFSLEKYLKLFSNVSKISFWIKLRWEIGQLQDHFFTSHISAVYLPVFNQFPVNVLQT